MHPNLLEILRCPYTGSTFTLSADVAGTTSEIEYAIVTSAAGDFPVVAGVLRLLPDRLQGPIVEFVRRGDTKAALTAALDVPYYNRWTALTNTLARAAERLAPGLDVVSRSKQGLFTLITEPQPSFALLAQASGEQQWANWQTYRFSMPTFLPVHSLAHLARGRRAILDFGCGLGHSSFLLRRQAPEASVVCADYSFTAIYLARRFFVPDAACLCLDGDYPMPFRDGTFDLIFSTDAMQYIESKIALARDFTRALTPDGVIALAHLHNRRSSVKTGKALTPAGYDGLFAGMARRLYPEDAVVADYVTHGALALDRRYAAEQLENELAGVSLVAAHSEAPFQAHANVRGAAIDGMRRPLVNPAYAVRTSGRGVELEREIGMPYAIERTIDGCEILPKAWPVAGHELDAGALLELRTSGRPAFEELVRRFLVFDTPADFSV